MGRSKRSRDLFRGDDSDGRDRTAERVFYFGARYRGRERAQCASTPIRRLGAPVEGLDEHYFWWQSAKFGLVLVLDVHGRRGNVGLGTSESHQRFRTLESTAKQSLYCRYVAVIHGHHDRHERTTWKQLTKWKFPYGMLLNPGVTLSPIREGH